jgi:simple sugar transport system permease protein
MLMDFVPLCFCAFSFILAAKAGIFNLGTEGQYLIGCLAGLLAGIYCVGLPPAIHVLLCLLVAFVAGALWGTIASLLKVFLNVNELISTMMLGYVAKHLVDYLVDGPFKAGDNWISQTLSVQDSAKLSVILPGSRLNTGFLLAIALVILCTFCFFVRHLDFRCGSQESILMQLAFQE